MTVDTPPFSACRAISAGVALRCLSVSWSPSIATDRPTLPRCRKQSATALATPKTLTDTPSITCVSMSSLSRLSVKRTMRMPAPLRCGARPWVRSPSRLSEAVGLLDRGTPGRRRDTMRGHLLRGLRQAVVRSGRRLAADRRPRQADDLTGPFHTTHRRRGHAGLAQPSRRMILLLQQSLQANSRCDRGFPLIQILDV